MPGALNGDRQILVFRKRIERKSAEFDEHRTPPCPHRTRNHRKRVERSQRPALEILCDDVFQRLPARDHVDAVSDLRISSDSAYSRIDKPARESRDRVATEQRIGIQRHHDFTIRARQSGIQSRGLAGIVDGQNRDARIVAEAVVQDFGGAILGAIVDDNDLKPWIIARQNALDR